jgi:mRNA interferase RelE/StbE
MAQVVITPSAQMEFEQLPRLIQFRVAGVFRRLHDWPNVSGAKPLRGNLHGSFRIRTGDYRVVFKPSPDDQVVTVWKIGYRGDVYD